MPGKITLEVAPAGAECVICPNAATFRLTLGAGYRAPADLCGNCTAALRITLGPPNLAKTQRQAFERSLVPDFNASAPGQIIVLPSITDRNREKSL